MLTSLFSADCRHLNSLLTAALAAALAGCSTIGSGFEELLDEAPVSDIEFSSADEVDYKGAGTFERRVYGGLGIGASRLEPDTAEDGPVQVNDRVEPGGQITAGADLSNTFSVELHSADLGSAGLSPSGRINYRAHGGSVLLYAGRDRAERSGLMGYGRVGVSMIKNSPVGNVTFTSDEDPQALLGAGVEYGVNVLGQKLGVRGEVIVFDKDAQFAQLGVVYRLGGSDADTAELPDTINPVVLPPTLPQPAPAPTGDTTELPEPQIPEPPVTGQPTDELVTITELSSQTQELPDGSLTAVAGEDTDQDGIPNELDACPSSTQGIEVDDTGCAIFNGVIDGVNFERGSAELTAEAKITLDGVVATLWLYPDALVAIAAHTDGMGREEDNLTLSRDRAIAVARYLITRGVPKAQMSARAFGEYQPIADNDTAEGRALNRRVEIVASRSDPQN